MNRYLIMHDLLNTTGELMSSNERQIKSQIKVGAGLAIFGLVCPFFWMSLFSGQFQIF